jgi:hypothetical protein
MQSLLEQIREILGTPDFYHTISGYNNATWDYGAMIEYAMCGIILCVTIASAFKFLRALIK